MRPFTFLLAPAVALALAAPLVGETVSDAQGGETGRMMAWADLFARPRPASDATISYGPDPLQIADLWLPAGDGPHPTVLMVHGGCWQTDIAERTIMNWIAVSPMNTTITAVQVSSWATANTAGSSVAMNGPIKGM